jgi:hypothetical protein
MGNTKMVCNLLSPFFFAPSHILLPWVLDIVIVISTICWTLSKCFFFLFFFFFFGGTGVWTQGLLCACKAVHLALVSLEIGVSRTTCLGWPVTSILLISVSLISRITSISHQHHASLLIFHKSRSRPYWRGKSGTEQRSNLPKVTECYWVREPELF